MVNIFHTTVCDQGYARGKVFDNIQNIHLIKDVLYANGIVSFCLRPYIGTLLSAMFRVYPLLLEPQLSDASVSLSLLTATHGAIPDLHGQRRAKQYCACTRIWKKSERASLYTCLCYTLKTVAVAHSGP